MVDVVVAIVACHHCDFLALEAALAEAFAGPILDLFASVVDAELTATSSDASPEASQDELRSF